MEQFCTEYALKPKLVNLEVGHVKIMCILGLGTAYRNRTAVYRGTLLHTAVRTTVYRNSIKLTVIVNLSTAMGIHLIDMPTSHGV